MLLSVEFIFFEDITNFLRRLVLELENLTSTFQISNIMLTDPKLQRFSEFMVVPEKFQARDLQ
jgi:hypothetical protein